MRYRDDYTISTACAALHAHVTGSGDQLSQGVIDDLTTWLRWRLDNWTATPRPEWVTYDKAYRGLIRATLAEAGRNPRGYVTTAPQVSDERLTDEELAHFERALVVHLGVVHPDVLGRAEFTERITVQQMRAMLSELRTRRQRDLTSEEREALEACMDGLAFSGFHPGRVRVAISALSRLLGTRTLK